MQLVAEISKGQIVHAAKHLPTWITQYLGQLFNTEIKLETKARDLNSIEEVRKRYLENKLGPENNR